MPVDKEIKLASLLDGTTDPDSLVFKRLTIRELEKQYEYIETLDKDVQDQLEAVKEGIRAELQALEAAMETFELTEGPRGERGEKGEQGERGADGKDGADGRDGVDGRDGIDGRDGVDGEDGEIGPMPQHEWKDTWLRFQLSDEEWGEWVNLQGPAGNNGKTTGTQRIRVENDGVMLGEQVHNINFSDNITATQSGNTVDVKLPNRLFRTKSVYTANDTTDDVALHICDSGSEFTLTVTDGSTDGEEIKIMNRGAGIVTLSGKISLITATSILYSGESIVLNWDVTDDEWQ